ncbi:MAG: type II secretion system protein [Verrucomicrobiaceae bacterium]
MKRGFTLTEILIVVAVIGALVAIGLPIGKMVKEKTERAACQNVLRNLGVCLEGYLSDHNDMMPPLYMGRKSKNDDAAVLEVELLPYARNEFAFECPSDHEHFEKSGSSYFWNETLSGMKRSRMTFMGSDADGSVIPLIFDKESYHGEENGVNFLYADQSIQTKLNFSIGARN